jgi:hypothetical protein
MAKPRPQMTSIDYVVIALSPLLIMVLVGSLCFFLLEVGYRGQFSGRLHWILFWYVVATVGIARISMEEGAERASVYGLGLVGAVALAVLRFLDSPWIAWSLMALVWWCAHKLTWDCTLIDDEQDASGEGLLQVAGLEEGLGADAAKGDDDDDEQETRPAWWRRMFESPEERRKRPHAPGVWVIYFSLAALPLFGLGQALIPSADIGRRQQAFWLLVWYVASGMGLLLTTSFLGLRRYLRQRKLEMPLTMTGAWLGVGAALIVILILVTMLVPRPNPEYPIENLIAKAISSPLRKASKHALLRDDGVQQGPAGSTPGDAPHDSQQDGTQPADSKDQASQQSGGQQSGGQQSGGQQSGGQQSRGQQSGGQQSGGQQSGGQQSGGQQSGGQQSGAQQSGGQQSGGQQSGGQQSGGQQSGGQQSGGQQSGGQQSGGQQSGGQQSGGQQSGGQQSGGQQSGAQQSGGQQSGGQQSGGQQSGGQQSGGQQSGGQQSGGQQSGGQQSGGQQSGGQQSGGQQSGGQQSGGQQSGGQQSGGQQSGGQQSGGQQSGGQQSGGQQSGGQQSGGQQSGGQQSGAQQSGEQQSGGQQSGGQQSGGQQSGEQKGDEKAEESKKDVDQSSDAQQQDQANQTAADTPKPETPPTPPQPSRLPKLSSISLTSWIRWLMWGALAAAAVVGFMWYRSQVIAFIRQLWAEFLSLWGDIFGGKKSRRADAAATEVREPERPFAAFKNPFASGKAGRLPPEQLVRYTFEALEAWSFERQAARRREETPLEFAEALSGRYPALAQDARQLARLYSQMVYARTNPSRDCLPLLQRLWSEMQQPSDHRSARPASTATGG